EDSQAVGLFDPVEIGGHTGIVLHAVRIVAGVPPRRCHTDLFPIRDLGTPGVTVPGRTGVTLALNRRTVERVGRLAGHGDLRGFQLRSRRALSLFPAPPVDRVLLPHTRALLRQLHGVGLHGLVQMQQQDIGVRVDLGAVHVDFHALAEVHVADTHVHAAVLVQTVSGGQYPGRVDDAPGTREPT